MNQKIQTKNYSNRAFLIVDDKRFLRDLIHGMLVQCQASDIRHAKNGDAAILALEDARGAVDCVLCDWNMDPINGLELLKLVRSGSVQGTPRDLRFIMLTGYSEERVVKAALDLDVSGFVAKPVSKEKLIRAIDAAFLRRIALKPAETYRAKATLELPETWDSPARKPPPGPSDESEANPEYLPNSGPRIVNQEYVTTIDAITPGKILAESVVNKSGRLLLAEGTELDKTRLSKLKELQKTGIAGDRIKIGDYQE